MTYTAFTHYYRCLGYVMIMYEGYEGLTVADIADTLPLQFVVLSRHKPIISIID